MELVCEDFNDVRLIKVAEARLLFARWRDAARMAEEAGRFEFGDVVEAITKKMIRRHPHVFGDDSVRGKKLAKGMWEKIKAERFRLNDPARVVDVAALKIKWDPPERDYPLGVWVGSMIGKVRDILKEMAPGKLYLGCRFCATARMRTRRDLEGWEMVEQFRQAREMVEQEGGDSPESRRDFDEGAGGQVGPQPGPEASMPEDVRSAPDR